MYVTIKMALAMIKRRKLQSSLTGVVIALIGTLLYIGLSIMNQSSSFSVMFERASATEELLILSKATNDPQTTMDWWASQEKVIGTLAYESHMTNIEYQIEDDTKAEMVLLTEFPQDTQWDQLYVYDNELAKVPTDNEILINYNFANNRELEIGDQIVLNNSGTIYSFEIAGMLVDPHFSNPFLTPARCFITPGFFEENEILNDTILMGIKYADETSARENRLYKQYVEDINEQTEPLHVGYDAIESSYSLIINIIASILLVVALFIFIIVIFVIRSTIRNIVLQQYKEIGVKKAIGYTNQVIRNSLLWTYSIIGMIATTIGVLIGFPIRNIINGGLSHDIQVDQASGLDSYVLLTILIIVSLIIVFTWITTKSATKIMPVQAIKYGMPEQKVSHNAYDVSTKKVLPLNLILAIKQLLMNRKGSITTALILTILIYSAMVIANTGYTITDEAYLASHLVGLELPEFAVNYSENKPVSQIVTEIKSLDQVTNVVYLEFQMSKSTEDLEGNNLGIGCNAIYGDFPEKGIILSDGRSPVNEAEIVISSKLAELTGKATGDYITMVGEAEDSYLVSGIYNSITFASLGYVTLKEEIPNQLISGNGFYWVYSDTESVQIESINQEVKDALGESASVSRFDSNIESMVSTVEAFPMVINVLLIVLVIISGVIIFNFTMMDINNSIRTFGIMKATGFSNNQITRIIIIRTMIITTIGTAAGFILNLLTMNKVMESIFSITPFATIEMPVIFSVEASVSLVLLFFVITLLGTLLPAKKIATVSPKQLISE